MPERFYSASQQTRRTKAVQVFAERVAPKGIRHAGDLRLVVRGVRSELYYRKNTFQLRSVNPLVNERLDHEMAERELIEGAAEKYRKLCLARAATCGIRTAHQILVDGHADKQYGCIDLNTVILAVLRHHGVPCRAVNITTHKGIPGTTSIIELELNGRQYRLQPLLVNEEKRVRRGLVERNRAGQELYTGKDHASTGLDFRDAVLQAQEDTRRLTEASMR